MEPPALMLAVFLMGLGDSCLGRIVGTSLLGGRLVEFEGDYGFGFSQDQNRHSDTGRRQDLPKGDFSRAKSSLFG